MNIGTRVRFSRGGSTWTTEGVGRVKAYFPEEDLVVVEDEEDCREWRGSVEFVAEVIGLCAE